LPIAVTAGSEWKRSYLRVSGAPTVLTFVESITPGANVLSSMAAVAACPVAAEGWTATTGGALADAPSYSAAGCVAAVNANGVWTIDVHSFPSLDRRGIALVARPVGAVDHWQVTLQPVT
jgi:hypothetical protein